MMEEYYKQLGFTSDNSGLLELIKNQKMVDALEMKSDSTTKDVHWVDENQISLSKLGKKFMNQSDF